MTVSDQTTYESLKPSSHRWHGDMADIAETRASTSREVSELQTASEQLALQKTRFNDARDGIGD